MTQHVEDARPNEFGKFVYSNTPGYVEASVRSAFSHAVPLRTVVIFCYDPRAANIPRMLARLLPDEVYPGELVLNGAGQKVGSTATIFPVVIAGGRAIDAIRSIMIAQHLFSLTNIVVVHHTFCGTTSFTPQGLIDAFGHEQGTDVSELYERASLAIEDFKLSLQHDVHLLRTSKGIPKMVKIFGYLFDIDMEEFTLIVKDAPTAIREAL